MRSLPKKSGQLSFSPFLAPTGGLLLKKRPIRSAKVLHMAVDRHVRRRRSDRTWLPRRSAAAAGRRRSCGLFFYHVLLITEPASNSSAGAPSPVNRQPHVRSLFRAPRPPLPAHHRQHRSAARALWNWAIFRIERISLGRRKMFPSAFSKNTAPLFQIMYLSIRLDDIGPQGNSPSFNFSTVAHTCPFEN